jgi:CHAT domain-containing protein
MAYEDLEETQKALNLYKKAESYLLSDKETPSFLPDVYVGIAHIYFYDKDIGKAERYAEKAMDIGLKHYGEFSPNMTFVYNSYRHIFELKEQYKESIKLLKKIIKIRENTYGKDHVWTCESYYDLAKVYILDKQYENAENSLKTAIKIGEKVKSYQYLADAQSTLADLYLDQNIHTNEVDDLLENALTLKTNIFGEKNDVVADTYYLMAKNNLNQDDKVSFFRNLKNTYTSANFNKNDLYNVISPFQVIDALILEGDWYQKEYKKTGETDLLKKKFNLIDTQIKMIKYVERNFSSDKSKISFANDYRTIFEKGLNTCWQLYKETGKHRYLQKAFDLSETNRNTILLSGLQDNKFKIYANIPPGLLSREKELEKKLSKVKMDLYYEKKSSSPDKEFLSDLIEKRMEVNKDLDSLHEIFIGNYSRYKSLKYNNHVIQLEDVQKELDNSTQLMIYFLDADNLYSFLITSDEVRFNKAKNSKNISEDINRFKKDLKERKDISVISKKLYDILLKDRLVRNKSSLVIIPDNILSYIPFEALKDQNDNYLLKQYKVSYSGSTRLFLELKDDLFNYKNSEEWAGFSPAYDDKNMLNATDQEVGAIGKIMEGKIFLGKEATKENFLTHNTDFNILHLAMHARIDNENPMFNKLAFFNGDLTSSEIYISENKANLVVLSACNTGFGKIEKGEGVMSLARAFHFSGVPAVVMSLWKVPDKETKKIMVYFYEYLKTGMNKSEALQKAKIKYLKTTKDNFLKLPYYWSGFVLNGNSIALYKRNTFSYLISLIGIITLVLIILIYKKYFR